MYTPDKNDGKPLYIQIYEHIKQDIAENRLVRGEKLTSGRLLAKGLGVSRNTVELAYEKLVSEGIVENRARKGYFVIGEINVSAAKSATARQKPPVYDMRICGRIPPGFPVIKWKQCLAKAVSDLSVYGIETKDFGDVFLKEQIFRFLYKYRSISCGSDNIFLFNGMQSCLDAVLPLSDCGAENDEGFLFLERDTRALPLRAANEDIIYINSFYGIVFPAGNIAYAVLPEKYAKKLAANQRNFCGPDSVVCRALAYFMCDDKWDRYVYRLTAEENIKIGIMENVCREVFGRADKTDRINGTVTVAKTAAQSIIKKAETIGIFADADGDELILGVRGLKKEDIIPAVRLLYENAVKK